MLYFPKYTVPQELKLNKIKDKKYECLPKSVVGLLMQTMNLPTTPNIAILNK